MGKQQLRLLKFCLKYPTTWHTYGKDYSTVRVVKSLEDKGLIIRNLKTRQFRLNVIVTILTNVL